MVQVLYQNSFGKVLFLEGRGSSSQKDLMHLSDKTLSYKIRHTHRQNMATVRFINKMNCTEFTNKQLRRKYNKMFNSLIKPGAYCLFMFITSCKNDGTITAWMILFFSFLLLFFCCFLFFVLAGGGVTMIAVTWTSSFVFVVVVVVFFFKVIGLLQNVGS